MLFYYGTNENTNIYGQCFSGTDKSTKYDDIGIVYPLSCNDNVKDMLNISSILDHRHTNLCKNTEARIANADTEKKIVEYKETRCVALEYDNEKNDLDQLLVKSNHSIYQSEAPMTSKLRVRIDDITALLSTKNFNALHFIDSENLEAKTISYTYSPTLFDFDEWIPPDNNQLCSADRKIAELFTQKFVYYFQELNESKQNKVIKYAFRYYFDEPDIDKLLSSSLWGKDIDNTSKEYKVLFSNESFKKYLANNIIDFIEYHDYEVDDDNKSIREKRD